MDAVKKIETQYRSSAVDRREAAKLLGYSGLSGPANQTLAALTAYGLLERAGKGDARVTELAREILYPRSDEERWSNLVEAASSPRLFQELRERFRDLPVPPEEGVVNHLNRSKFNPNAVRRATNAFLGTAEYLKERWLSGGREQEELGDAILESSPPSELQDAQVGDFVQWESQEVLQFPKPMRVRAVSDDGDWVFVDGSETGIPMRETIIERMADPPPSLPPLPPESPPVLALEPEEFEWLRDPVGKTTSVRLMVVGNMGSREVKRLLRTLQNKYEALLEDEGDNFDIDESA